MKKTYFAVLPMLIAFSTFCQNTIEVESVGSNVNKKYINTVVPRVSSDGKTLWFSRIYSSYSARNLIFYSELDSDGTWGEAKQAIFPLNTGTANQVWWISPDGNRMLIDGYFRADKPVEKGFSICTKLPTGGWAMPVGIEIKNFKKVVGYTYTASMSSDEKVLILSFDKKSGFFKELGGALTDYKYMNVKAHLYVSFKEGEGTYSEPKSLGAFFENKDYTFEMPYLSPDGKTLYFSSDFPGGIGGYDVWKVKRLDDSWQGWSQPENLGAPINTTASDLGFFIDAKEEVAYVQSNIASRSSVGNYDIYRINLKAKLKPKTEALIRGKIFNAKTKEPLSASLVYQALPEGKSTTGTLTSQSDGSYVLNLPFGKYYSLRASADNFIGVSENLDLTKTDKYVEIQKDLYLVPMEKGQTIRLNSIFFDFGKATLRAESFPELDRLLAILQENPKLEIEVSGHTDNVGNDVSNLKLSDERAKAVMTYLNYRGIPANRIAAKGYGKIKPVASNDTDDGRQLNRRVEFTILKS